MLEVYIDYQDNDIIYFKVTGHAGYAEEGQDIYCAGVSAITQTVLLGLDKHLKQKAIFKIEKGYLDCSLARELSAEDNSKAQIILSTMEAGLLSMAEAYGEYIKVIIRRC